MIISESLFDTTYRPGAEDNYDYLVRSKKKKAEHKQAKATIKRQVKTAIKHPLRTGFGLFQQVEKKVGANIAAVKKIINTPTSEAYPAEKAAPLTEETTPAAEMAENQSAEDNATGPENEQANERNEKKKPEEKNASNSPLIGVFFLGLTFFIAAYALYKTDQKSEEHLQHFKKAA